MEKLGIEPFMLLTQVVNFTILVIVLTKFLYKPILKILDERRKKIEEGLVFSSEMAKKKEELEEEREKILNRAKSEGVKIVEDYKSQAKKIEADIIAKANQEVRAIREKAKTDLERQKSKLFEELSGQVYALALELAQRAVSGVLDDKAHKILLEKKLKLLESEKLHAD